MESLAAPQVVELAADEVLLPGLVDTHVHVNEPGRTDWEGFTSASRAAAAGGITTLLDMPLNSIPPTTDPAALELKRSAAGSCVYVDVGFWGGAVPDNLGTLRTLWDAGVHGFKCFLLPSGVAEFAELDFDGLGRAMAEIAVFDGLLLVHAEDPGVIAAAPAAVGPRYLDFLASRPAEAELRAITALVETARVTGCRTHVVHVSDADSAELIASARDDGVAVSCETCPHYLTLAAEDVPAGATAFKCCPPIRDDANRDRLWAALRSGAIDLVVSDHSPSPPALKALDTGDFGSAWGGISSLQIGLPLVWTEARRRGFDLADVVRWMATAPANLAGHPDRGRIAVGALANFCVLAPDAEFDVAASTLLHRHPVTPYAGRRLTGVVRATWLRGEPIDLSTAPRGRLAGRVIEKEEQTG